MNILLLGGNGQLGHELQRSLLPLGRVTALTRQELDLAQGDLLSEYIQRLQPELIVNAAAYTAVDLAESNIALAQAVNADAVARMASYCADNNKLLLHYSTDYVFDGQKHSAYVETDATRPLNVYGQSKLAGEQALMASGAPQLIFRTSWVYSAYGKNFINTILRLAKTREQLSVVADQIGAPTSVELLADVSALSINAWQKGLLDSGLYHLTAAGSCSWHELARYVVDAVSGHTELCLKSDNILAISTDQYPLPAARPMNSRLNCRAIEQQLGVQLPTWQIYVERMLKQLYQENKHEA